MVLFFLFPFGINRIHLFLLRMLFLFIPPFENIIIRKLYLLAVTTIPLEGPSLIILSGLVIKSHLHDLDIVGSTSPFYLQNLNNIKTRKNINLLIYCTPYLFMCGIYYSDAIDWLEPFLWIKPWPSFCWGCISHLIYLAAVQTFMTLITPF